MEPGFKDDANKLRLSLLPWRALEGVAEVMEYGIKKYGREGSWKLVEDGERRYGDAALRHLAKWSAGEDIDPESGLLHLAHASCSILFALWFRLKGPSAEETITSVVLIGGRGLKEAEVGSMFRRRVSVNMALNDLWELLARHITTAGPEACYVVLFPKGNPDKATDCYLTLEACDKLIGMDVS